MSLRYAISHADSEFKEQPELLQTDYVLVDYKYWFWTSHYTLNN